MKIHFIGVCGASMSKLAAARARRGDAVSGSDSNPGRTAEELRRMGVTVYGGHAAGNAAGAELVVVTAAVREDNPELAAARARGVPVLGRAEFLGRECDKFSRVAAFSGAHGKTTAAGMAAVILRRAGLRPALHIGGDITGDCGLSDGIGGAGAEKTDGVSRGDAAADGIMVVEACEYKRSFLHIRADFPVILNIALDHTDCYADEEDITDAFSRFARNVRPGGAVTVNGDDVRAVRAAESAGTDIVKFGLSEGCDYRALNLRSFAGLFSFSLSERGKKLADVTLSAPGRHNVYNALAAAATARRLSVGAETVAEGLRAFRGMKRRFEERGGLNGARIIHDYAHHPDEITATVAAARLLGPKRVLCVFQPHTYTRTRALFDGFVRALSGADAVYLAQIYAARESPLRGVTSDALAAAARRARAFPDFNSIRAALASDARAGDIILVLGAGDIDELYPAAEINP